MNGIFYEEGENISSFSEKMKIYHFIKKKQKLFQVEV